MAFSSTAAQGGSGDITGVTITTDTGGGSKAEDTNGSADFSLLGGDGIDVTNSGATITIAGEAATDENAGVVELATDDETNASSSHSETLAVTPYGLENWEGSENIDTLGAISTGTWGGDAIEGVSLAATGVTDGYILTADGSDGCSWEEAAGGGTMSEWVIEGDGESEYTIEDGETCIIAGGAGITTEASSGLGPGDDEIGVEVTLDLSTLADYTDADPSGWPESCYVAAVDDSDESKKIRLPAEIGVACSDETTALTTGRAAAVLIPRAMTVTEIKLSLTTPSTSGVVTVNVSTAEDADESSPDSLFNDGSEDIAQDEYFAALSGLDATDGLDSSYNELTEDYFVMVDVDDAGTGAAGLKIWLLGYWT